jgi:hypothetical protein
MIKTNSTLCETQTDPFTTDERTTVNAYLKSKYGL